MRDEKVFFSNKFRVAVFDYGSGFHRSGLDQCEQEFPAVEVVGETYVHRILRNAGLNPEEMARFGDVFEPYKKLRGIHLLLIAFREGGEHYLRIVNYLGRYVSTVVLDIQNPTCEDILRAQRIVAVESNPPFADIQMNGRKLGESPLWIFLRDGSYEIECKLPGQMFSPIRFKMPGTAHVQCSRENVQSKAQVDEFHKMSGEEKAGSVLIYLVGIAGAIGLGILPFLLFL